MRKRLDLFFFLFVLTSSTLKMPCASQQPLN